MQDSKNFFVAIALSMIVLIGWNVFFGLPTAEKARKEAQMQAQVAGNQPAGSTAPSANPAGPANPAATAIPDLSLPGAPAATREAAIAASPRIAIDSARVRGSIALKGGDVDDIALKDYHETVDPKSPNIVVFSPPGGPEGYFARFGWLASAGASAADLPGPQTLWTADIQTLTEATPVTLTYDNGKGLVFRRKIAIDDNFMLTVADSVENKGSSEANLTPYGFIRRIGTPHVQGYYILHEGLLGVLGSQGLAELKYADLLKEPTLSANEKGRRFADATGGWLGITDKYWASALVPDQKTPFQAAFTVTTAPGAAANNPAAQTFQTLMSLPATAVAPGASVSSTSRLFVGAKEVKTLDYYESQGIDRFKLLIDWGWFWFITQPMFKLLDTIFKFTGNFGIAILVVTVIVKGIFFPLANKSYSSMAKMKAVQPQMQALKELYPDDKVKQQQELMELYKKEKINPLAGCLPVLLQIPVFFSLYKVLFVTIEMRHAPFFGWIRDLAAPDPTSVFNLFGALPFDVPTALHIGVWPLIMGVTMFVQMKMNPEPADPVQKTMFTWMPVFFTYLLASFPAGLVIYWSWNNALSVSQQYLIMKRQGVKVELWDNLRNVFNPKPKVAPVAAGKPGGGKPGPGNPKADKPA
jgi:YidC/Oxa1 family membrane protein insertase